MRVIVFYAYKGGTGKSLAAANFAACICRIGKSCALLDMDFDGPSLHGKIGAETAPGAGGFLQYLLSHIKEEPWPEKPIHNLEFHPDISDLAYYTRTIPGTRLKHLAGRLGIIHFLPAGDVSQEHYWDCVFSPLYHYVFSVHTELLRARITEEEYIGVISYLRRIRDEISNLEPEPEYLIIDLRSGASEVASTVVAAWQPTMVCMFSFNDVSIEWLSDIRKKVRFATSQKTEGEESTVSDTENGNSVEVVPVLSRIPAGIVEFRGDRKLRAMLQDLELGMDDLYVLHSDRDLEMNEELRLGYDRSPKNTLLAHDYLRLFGRLTAIPLERLMRETGLSPDLHELDRIFRLEADRGALINPNDDSRNVSFKVETFQLLLRGFEEELESSHFGADIVLDWSGFCKSLVEGGRSEAQTPVKHIWELLSTDARRACEMVMSSIDEAQGEKAVVISAVDTILGKTDFYQEAAFAEFAVPDETVQLLRGPRRDLSERDLRRLNRQLLEAVFPTDLLKSHEASSATEDLRKLLFSAGNRCGERFGVALRNMWAGHEFFDQDKIQKWCNFDSDVGFGKFQIDLETIQIRGREHLSVDVLLRESFLTPSVDTAFREGTHRFCEFFTGYIRGVLTQILAGDITVAHRDMTAEDYVHFFGAAKPRSESCIFAVTRNPSSQRQ